MTGHIDILEALFDTMGPVDADLRHRLSRASDRVMTTLVERSCGAVLTSFWRNPGRFLHRSRHPGHLDAVRNQEALLTQFRRVGERGPLGIGRVIVRSTATRQDIETLIEEITTVFAEYAASPHMG